MCYGGDCPQLWSQTHILESGHFNLTTVCTVMLEKPLPPLDPLFPRNTLRVTNSQGVVRIKITILIKMQALDNFYSRMKAVLS